jgi:hypothetical protein
VAVTGANATFRHGQTTNRLQSPCKFRTWQPNQAGFYGC